MSHMVEFPIVRADAARSERRRRSLREKAGAWNMERFFENAGVRKIADAHPLRTARMVGDNGPWMV